MANDPPHSSRLGGTVCVVTGAARGIGAAIAERLGADGGRVACLDISARRLAPTVEALAARGPGVRAYAVDIADRGAVRTAFAAIEHDFGAPVGVLVNNAVWARFQPLDAIDDEALDRTFAVGLKASVWTMQAAVPQMRRRGGGAIVNLASTSALRGLEGSIVYSAMKAGVLGLTQSAAVELAPHGIRVNAVVPGMVGTPAATGQSDDRTLQRRIADTPAGRFGEPAEIAAMVAFLASDECRYLQGAGLVVDGGWSIAAR